MNPITCSKTAVSLFLAATLSACGGGGSSGGSSPLEDDFDAGTPEASSGSPDFAITSFLMSDPRQTTNRASVRLSITNIGADPAEVPAGWLMVSDSEDFSTGFGEHRVTFRPENTNDDMVLEPGEETSFVALDNIGSSEINISNLTAGTHYARIELNPDVSRVFEDSGRYVAEQRGTFETDYTNNGSETISYGGGIEDDDGRLDCPPDALEQNDTLETAAPISLYEQYAVNDCDDSTDVFSADLAAGNTYQVTLHEGAANVSRIQFSVIAPDGRYVVQRQLLTSPFEIDASGIYRLVFQTRSTWLYNETTFSLEEAGL